MGCAQHSLRLPPVFPHHLPCCLHCTWLMQPVPSGYFLIDPPSPAWEKASMQLRAGTCLETSAAFWESLLFPLDNKNLWLKELFGIGNVIKCSLCPTSVELTNSPLTVARLMRKEALLKSSGYFCIVKGKGESKIFQWCSFQSPIKRKEKRERFYTITVSSKQLTY